MARDIEDAEQYLRETLHAPVTLEAWYGVDGLPNYLSSRYRFFAGTVENVRILLVQADEELTPTTAMKHLDALRQHWTGPIAFVLGSITARSRQRLVNEGIAFVVPRNQVYLPMLGITLTERFTHPTVGTDRLRPSAQLLLLHLLNKVEPSVNTPSAAAKLLGYTAMAMGQALNQLEAANLVRIRKIGRERVFELATSPAEVWKQAQPVLVSPVKRRRYAAEAHPVFNTALAAGLSALAEYSALAEPRIPVVAVSSALTKELVGDQSIDDRWPADEAALEVEFWSYAPELLATDDHAVDRLSLFLSLREDPDERVQSALEEMMRGMSW